MSAEDRLDLAALLRGVRSAQRAIALAVLANRANSPQRVATHLTQAQQSATRLEVALADLARGARG
jgi:hypothetical protein